MLDCTELGAVGVFNGFELGNFLRYFRSVSFSNTTELEESVDRPVVKDPEFCLQVFSALRTEPG